MERLPENCTDFQALLPLYVGSDLDPVEQDAVRFHLKDCEECRALAQRGERARLALAGQGDQTGGFSESRLWAGVRTQLLSDGILEPEARTVGAASAGPRLSLVRTNWRTWVGSAAAAALVITFGVSRYSGSPAELIPTPNPIATVVSEEAPAASAADVVATVPASLPVSEIAQVGLRRAQPGEERMIDTAAPYQGVLFVPSGASSDGTALTGNGTTTTVQRPTRARRIR